MLRGGLDAVQSPVETFSSRQEAGVAYARNLDVDSEAPGGLHPELVPVTLSPGELEEFRRGITT